MLRQSKQASNAAGWQDWSAHENCDHIPNAETIAAFEETEEIIRRVKSGEYSGPSYKRFADLLAEIDEEIEAEARAL